MDLEQEITRYIIDNADEKKAKFDKKIFKTELNVYGVKTFLLRKKAKEIKNKDIFSINPHICYEKDFILGTAVAYSNLDLKTKFDFFENFFKSVDNWAIVDGVACSLKLNKKDYCYVKQFIINNHNSEYEFLARFCYVVLLHSYSKKEYISDILTFIKKDSSFYVLMSEAWLLATCYLSEKEQITEFLKTLDKKSDLLRFTLRKLCDSYRLTNEEKTYIKELFR